MDRIWQSNEDLVTIMSDLAKQSKGQTKLLGDLVDGFQDRAKNAPRTPIPRTPRLLSAQPSQDDGAAPQPAS